MNQYKFIVEGMSCQHCAQAITNSVKELNGVSEVFVDLTEKTVTVNCDGTPAKDIKEKIDEQGFVVL